MKTLIPRSLLMPLIALSCLSGCSSNYDFGSSRPPEVPLPVPTLQSTSEPFASCEEFTEWRNAKIKQWNEVTQTYYQWLASSRHISYSGQTTVASGSGSVASPAAPATNNQISGVDEPDIVKSDEARVYFARTSQIEIFGRQDLTPLQTLTTQDLTNIKLLLTEKRLLALGTAKDGFHVRVFRRNKNTFLHEEDLVFQGSYQDARMSKDNLVLVTNLAITDTTQPDFPCSQIQRPFVDDFSLNMTAVHNIRLAQAEISTDSRAIVGRADQIFMSKRHLYVLSSGISWFYWDPRVAQNSLYNNSVLTMLELHPNQAPEVIGASFLEGRVRNQFAFNEDASGKHLFVATTYQRESTQANRLWVFGRRHNSSQQAPEGKFELLGQSAEFGLREDIRAVRFLGERAYVVTFERTDPLFAFDLSQPEAPRLMSHLEIPGFSAYLHPIGDNLLFGAGYATAEPAGSGWLDGIQLSLFRTEENGTVRVVEQKKIGNRGSHVSVGSNHHAFSYDPRRGLIGLPVRIMRNTTSKYGSELDFSGALLLSPNEAGLQPIGQLTHREWLSDACREQLNSWSWWSQSAESPDIRRVVMDNEKILTISPFGAKAHQDHPPFTTVQELRFSETENECTPAQPGWLM